MRVFVSVALVVLLLEATLILAFLAGYYWIGGWVPGALLCAIVLLLIVMPWIGDLEVLFDSAKEALDVRLAWWGSARVRLRPTVEVRGRFLLIPFTRRARARKKPVSPREAEHQAAEPGPPTAEPRPEEPPGRRRPGRHLWRAITERITEKGLGLEKLGDLVLAAGRAAHELLWRAKDLSVVVQSPTGNDTADTAIAGFVGHRTLGPVDLKCTPRGSRRIRVFFRIGLLRAALAAFLFLVEGKPPRRASKSRRAENRGPAPRPRPTSEPTEAD